jgi:hypothetical protein
MRFLRILLVSTFLPSCENEENYPETFTIANLDSVEDILTDIDNIDNKNTLFLVELRSARKAYL